MEDHEVLLSSNDDSNSDETFRYVQGMNQVSYYSCDAWEMFELPISGCLVDFCIINEPSLWLVRHYVELK